MSKAIVDATDAIEPVPTMKGPFVLPPGSWMSSDSILIKYSAAGVEELPEPSAPGPRGVMKERRGGAPTQAGMESRRWAESPGQVVPAGQQQVNVQYRGIHRAECQPSMGIRLTVPSRTHLGL